MPPTARTEERLRKQKQAKQKKVLLLLAPLLVILVAVQGPGLAKRLGKAQEQTEELQSQVVQGYEELAPEGVPVTGDDGEALDPDAALVAADGLANTDLPPAGDEETLISFTRFDARDPFVQIVEDVDTTGEGNVEEPTVVDTTGGSPSPSPDTGSTAPPPATGGTTGSTSGGGSTAAATEVTINVNGEVVAVKVGDTFPPGDPAFRVVAIEGDVVKIGLAGGSFSNGAETLDLEVGDTVTLISQPDGARFQIEIVKLG